MDFRNLPKVELHLHLDCSLSYEVVQQINPVISYEQYVQAFIAPPKCTDLADYIQRALRGIELMQTEEQLRLVTLDLMHQLKSDNVIYAEIRFAPLEHLRNGLTPEAVVATVESAVAEGRKETGVEARVILCTLRHYTEAQSMQPYT
jgi:adenosine deaminase